MIIEVPDDLSRMSRRELSELDERLTAAKAAIRAELTGAQSDRYADRPRWARALASVVDGPNRKKADRYVLLLAILIVLFFTLPNVLMSFIHFGEMYQASHYQGVPKQQPVAPILSDEQR